MMGFSMQALISLSSMVDLLLNLRSLHHLETFFLVPLVFLYYFTNALHLPESEMHDRYRRPLLIFFSAFLTCLRALRRALGLPHCLSWTFYAGMWI
jgi:hypothetical protein